MSVRATYHEQRRLVCPRVVDEDVDAAELVRGVRDRLVELALVSDIHAQIYDRRCALAFQFLA